MNSKTRGIKIGKNVWGEEEDCDEREEGKKEKRKVGGQPYEGKQEKKRIGRVRGINRK